MTVVTERVSTERTGTERIGTERGANTRRKLIDSTIAILREGGYAAANVQTITGRSGVAAGTLYRHFESKEQLFVEVFREVCGGEIDAMRAAASQHTDPADQMDAVVDTFARRALVSGRLAWALLAEPVDPLVDAERIDFRTRYRDLIGEILTQHQLAESEIEITASALVGAIGEAMVGPLAPTSKLPGEDDLIAQLQTIVRRAAGISD